MKTTITKMPITFLLLASGLFSFSFADAQCVCYCSHDNLPKYNAECYTKANGTLGCRRTRCRDGVIGNQEEETFSLFIHPNPVSASVTVPVYDSVTENASLQIFDVNGRLVTTLPDVSLQAGDNEITWNTSEVNSGIYILQFETASYSETRKLIVVR